MPPLKPLVAIDVDGVLLPFGKQLEPNPVCGQWLLSLADRAELVWATSWEHLANSTVAPYFGLPQLPVVEFASLSKTADMSLWCGQRPLAWIDDVFGADYSTVQWAARRGAPTLLIAPAPHVGLERQHVDRVWRWLDYLEG